MSLICHTSFNLASVVGRIGSSSLAISKLRTESESSDCDQFPERNQGGSVGLIMPAMAVPSRSLTQQQAKQRRLLFLEHTKLHSTRCGLSAPSCAGSQPWGRSRSAPVSQPQPSRPRRPDCHRMRAVGSTQGAIGLDLLIVGLECAMVVTAGTRAYKPAARFANPALIASPSLWSARSQCLCVLGRFCGP